MSDMETKKWLESLTPYMRGVAERDFLFAKKWTASPVGRYIGVWDFVETEYHLPLVRDILANSKDVLGVARFFVLPSNIPERVYTLTFAASAIHLDAVAGATSLWESLTSNPSCPPAPFVIEDAWRRSAMLQIPDSTCPETFQTWSNLKAASLSAVSCDSRLAGGECNVFRHRMCDRESETYAEWNYPYHTAQLLIDAYAKLLSCAGLTLGGLGRTVIEVYADEPEAIRALQGELPVPLTGTAARPPLPGFASAVGAFDVEGVTRIRLDDAVIRDERLRPGLLYARVVWQYRRDRLVLNFAGLRPFGRPFDDDMFAILRALDWVGGRLAICNVAAWYLERLRRYPFLRVKFGPGGAPA
jgi:hypothetical protein